MDGREKHLLRASYIAWEVTNKSPETGDTQLSSGLEFVFGNIME